MSDSIRPNGRRSGVGTAEEGSRITSGGKEEGAKRWDRKSGKSGPLRSSGRLLGRGRARHVCRGINGTGEGKARGNSRSGVGAAGDGSRITSGGKEEGAERWRRGGVSSID